ncbi:SAC3/GANP/Nin1/mts3/eIF-3 p25 family-domain-containing protein [Pseudomassariella vexata]|uniref:SAC3/GANP/Nin1/mts3/eIF-3 p25 family-domain-containing protein n=1 Tax=Pseudomassariella vexata TaxID=1141098 RepID=A0A1Y2EHR4_9PEZI|nr:SAC3/GANP/Nin1/mts3/eIF-3 p25 family-domain-containing protein [Pseudomassariella vexata]ORY71093.1 SAC3/GANP/Nin1/mts3/eIF-3 p25 family-domain-containing protein [Pseudomassariella vexata]
MTTQSNPFLQPAGSINTNTFASVVPANPNPFAQISSQTKPAAANPFAAASSGLQPPSNTFAAKRPRSASPFTQAPAIKPRQAKNPFAKDDFTTKPEDRPSAPRVEAKKVSDFVKPAWAKVSETTTNPSTNRNTLPNAKRKAELGAQMQQKHPKTVSHSKPATGRHGFPPKGPNVTMIGNAMNTHSTRRGTDEFAKRIYKQLAKDGIAPPQWPQDPGSRTQRAAMDKFREEHKNYREKARQSLIQAGLIDDPDEKKRLDQAIEFKGICEEMCPEWEKITRITEHDVKAAEKEDRNGEMVAKPQIMVKRLARSAAGQEAPLPMDVRSSAGLRKSLDYLIDELIPSDDLLPNRHNFLWDRTRAIRRDFAFQAYAMGPEEIKDQVYCLETIIRFHVTALHLLSQPGFAVEDFSEQQEIEQLGKSLLSLIHTYDDCADKEIECENEAEFRSYYVLFNAHDPALKETVQGWGARFWTSDDIRTAMCLVEAMENNSRLHGPLTPAAPTETALDMASMFFSIVSAPQISYTMACFAEIHFNRVRRSILQIIKKAYSRPRDGPKDLTPAFLRRRLHFDTEEEAIEYAEQHGLVFEEEMGNRNLVVNARQTYEEPRIPHSFSHGIVERKRCRRSLPDVIHETVFESADEHESPDHSEHDSLFVEEPQSISFESGRSTPLQDIENAEPTPNPILTSSVLHDAASKPSLTEADPKPKSLGIQPGTSLFAQADKPLGQSTSTIPPYPLSGLLQGSSSIFSKPPNLQSGQKSSEGLATVPPSQSNEKKVTFGDNTYIEPPSFPTSSNVSSSVFNFLNENDGHTPSVANPLNPSSGQSSWFPSIAPDTTTAAGNKDGSQGSIISGASATPGTGFKFSGFATTSSTAPLPASSTSVGPSPFYKAPAVKSPTSQDDALISSQVPPSGSMPALLTVSPPTQAQLSTSNPNTTTTDPRFALTQASFQLTPQAPTLAQPQPQNDPFGNFTRWFVCGDHGLLEDQLEEWLVRNLLENAWKSFQQMENERRRREEDEKSWAIARKYREEYLHVKFFYRWLEGFRKRSVVKRIKMERDKFRQWNLPENVAKREAAERATKERNEREVVDALRRSAKAKAKKEQNMRESIRTREQKVEEALLASGIFDGVRDQRAAAHLAARDDKIDSVVHAPPPSEKSKLRLENQRRRSHGLPPLQCMPEPQPFKEGSKTAKIKALSSGRDSLSMSTGSIRNSTFSSSYRSSIGFNNSRVAKTRKSRVSDPYWRLKANGLVQMPNGEYLHESLANPMRQEGKRYEGFGDFGLPRTASVTPSQSTPPRADLTDYSLPLEHTRCIRVSSSPSIASISACKRKRRPQDDEDKDLAAYRSEASASTRKRPRSDDSLDSDKEFLDRIGSLLQEVQKETRQ